MSKDQMRIKIAECCGWAWYQFKANDGNLFNQLIKGSEVWPTSKHFGGISIQRPDDSEHHASSAPDYPSDLNAMHDALMTLDKREQDVYAGHLGTLCGGRRIDYGLGAIDATTAILLATAEQQAIAFLKAKGLYE